MVIGIGGVYLFEEVFDKEKKALKEVADSTANYSQEDLQEIHLPNAKLVKRDGRFMVEGENFPCDRSVLDYVLQELSAIKVNRRLDKDQLAKDKLSEFLGKDPLQFSFDFGGDLKKYTIGIKLPHSEHFYMLVEQYQGDLKVSEELVVAMDTSQTPYAQKASDQGRSAARYKRIRSVLSQDTAAFLDKEIIALDGPKETLNLENVFIENRRNRAFAVDFKRNETTPIIIEGLEYRAEFMRDFRHIISNLRAKNVLLTKLKSMAILEKLESTMFLNLKDHWIKLYRKFDGKDGYFILTSFRSALYEVDSKIAHNFYLNVQDFWNKVVISPKSENANKDLKLNLGFANGSYKVSLPLKETFEVESEDDKLVANYENFKKLFQILTGVGPYEQADRVAYMIPEKLNAVKTGPHFNLDISGEKLIIGKTGHELLLINLARNLVYHYYVGEHFPISFSSSDYFYKMK